LYKSITILYLVCFGCYILFTRQPDYFDGERTPATIKILMDSASGKSIPKAVFKENKKEYAVDARYFLRRWSEGEKTEVIYETEHPEKGQVYAFFGYWMSWGEIFATVFIYLALFKVALSITNNPTPEAILEQLEVNTEKKKRYQD
jgi:hypothetical protein